MPNFIYKSKDQQGAVHQGEVEADSPRSAAILLRKKGLVVISVTQKQDADNNFFSSIFTKISFSEIVTVTRQLATMVSAGLVLSEAIDILEEQQTNTKFKKVLNEISDDVKGGLTLGQAMAKHPAVFPSLYINLIKSGETSGKLDQVLLRMADNLEKQREFQARVKGAMIYPAVVITMMLGVIFLMIVFVIPRLTSIYSQSSLELPLPTRILIGVSGFAANYWWLVLIILVLSFLIFKRWKATPEGRVAYDGFLLKVPLVGKIITNVTLANFCRTFALLVSAGIPLLEAINIVEGITDNSIFKNALKQAYVGVERGLSFSSLISVGVFPKIVGQMVRVGEETGKVDEIFFKLADYFESESDHMVRNLTTAIEPIILVILGLGVAFLVISIILPIYNLTTAF